MVWSVPKHSDPHPQAIETQIGSIHPDGWLKIPLKIYAEKLEIR